MPRRRATDRPPFSEMVTRANLDDRLATILRMHEDHLLLAVERWSAHRAVHEQVAESLNEYKVSANEWRQTLLDVRGTFIPKAEYQAEHRGLEAKIHGEIERVLAKVETLDARIDVLSSDVKDIHVEQTARRSVFSDSRNLIVTISLIFGIIASVLLLIDRFVPK